MVTVATLLRGYHAGKHLSCHGAREEHASQFFSAHRQGHRGFDCVRLAMSFFYCTQYSVLAVVSPPTRRLPLPPPLF